MSRPAATALALAASLGALFAYLSARKRSGGAGGAPVAVQNWSRNQTFFASSVAAPRTLAELSALVAAAPRVRVLGSAHCFNRIADPEGALLVRLDALENRAPVLDAAAGTVTVGAGVTYAALADALRGRPWALHNMASLPHISVGGAIATATHGSGVALGNLASTVRALEIVRADGTVETLRGAAAAAASVHLGALGVVTRVTLALVPARAFRQHVYEALPWAATLAALDDVLAAATSVSLFTTWAAPLAFQQAWRKSADGELPGGVAPAEWAGGTLARKPRHPCGADTDAAPCTEQGGVLGSWADRLPHFRASFTPSVGDELQSEFFVARADGAAALRALEPLAADIAKVLFVTEVRTIAADDAPLSMHSGRDSGSLAIHFTWKPEGAAVAALLLRIEAALAPFSARPHWGKLFSHDAAALERVYPRINEFRAMRRAADPAGKFLNAFLRDAGLE